VPYTIAFGVGLGFIVISLIAGEMMECHSGPFSFLQPILIAVFLTVGGGVGLLLSGRVENAVWAWNVLGISIMSGFLVAAAINRFVMVPLRKAENSSSFNIQETIGKMASVISPIPQGGYGKIKYNISGAVVTSPAKSEDGNEIRNGENVEIIYISENTYYVRRTG